jgi:hypothetical protein
MIKTCQWQQNFMIISFSKSFSEKVKYLNFLFIQEIKIEKLIVNCC